MCVASKLTWKNSANEEVVNTAELFILPRSKVREKKKKKKRGASSLSAERPLAFRVLPETGYRRFQTYIARVVCGISLSRS